MERWIEECRKIYTATRLKEFKELEWNICEFSPVSRLPSTPRKWGGCSWTLIAAPLMMWLKGAVMMSSGPELLGARGRATSEGWRINYVSRTTEGPLPPSPRYCDNCSLRCSSIGPRGPVARLCTGRSCAPFRASNEGYPMVRADFTITEKAPTKAFHI